MKRAFWASAESRFPPHIQLCTCDIYIWQPVDYIIHICQPAETAVVLSTETMPAAKVSWSWNKAWWAEQNQDWYLAWRNTTIALTSHCTARWLQWIESSLSKGNTELPYKRFPQRLSSGHSEKVRGKNTILRILALNKKPSRASEPLHVSCFCTQGTPISLETVELDHQLWLFEGKFCLLQAAVRNAEIQGSICI